MVTRPPFQRARTPQARERRAADLLGAAFDLAAQATVQSVTLPAIAEAAGVHRSAVARYFDSRDDVFLQLAGQGWGDWSAAVAKELGAPFRTGLDTERGVEPGVRPHAQPGVEPGAWSHAQPGLEASVWPHASGVQPGAGQRAQRAVLSTSMNRNWSTPASMT